MGTNFKIALCFFFKPGIEEVKIKFMSLKKSVIRISFRFFRNSFWKMQKNFFEIFEIQKEKKNVFAL